MSSTNSQNSNTEETSNSNNACNLCEKNDINLNKLQEAERHLKEQLTAAQELASRYENELAGERSYRKDLESKLTALSLETENKVIKCLETNSSFEQELELLAKKQESDLRVMQSELKSAKSKHKALESDFLKLNKIYQKLLGLNKEKANEMREKDIELPQTVDQLQFLALQLREELIETRAAYEHSVNELKDELVVAREHVLDVEEKLHDTERILHESGAHTNSLVGHELSDSVRSSINGEIIRYQGIIAELEHQIGSMQRDRTKNETALNEYKRRCTTLQQELDTCETVQKDFVQLSQKLQIQLEKIRQAEKEVRWQFDEDVMQCNQCEIYFETKNTKKEKLHCRHCGKIFCSSCLVNKISTGLNNKEAEVCDVCYTLLDRESVPFFSNMSTNDNNNK